MRVLVDESLPRQLVHELSEYRCATVQQQGWSGFKNGKLLRHASDARFRIFLTADQGIQYQQNLSNYGVGVVVVCAESNRMEHLRPLIPSILAAFATVEEGQVVRVG